MAEEMKQEEKKAEASKMTSAILKVIFGFVFLVLGVFAILCWWTDLVTVIKGCIGLFLLLAGIITLAIAKE